MPSYRLLVFAGERSAGPNHRITFECAGDDEAIRKARELADGRMVELWKEGPVFVWSTPARPSR